MSVYISKLQPIKDCKYVYTSVIFIAA